MITDDNERLCDDCFEPVTDDDQAPTCGEHDLHQECAEWFDCRDCRVIEPDPDLERKAALEARA